MENTSGNPTKVRKVATPECRKTGAMDGEMLRGSAGGSDVFEQGEILELAPNTNLSNLGSKRFILGRMVDSSGKKLMLRRCSKIFWRRYRISQGDGRWSNLRRSSLSSRCSNGA